MERIRVHAASALALSALAGGLWLLAVLGVFGEGVASAFVALTGVCGFVAGLLWLLADSRRYLQAYALILRSRTFVAFAYLAGLAFLALTIVVAAP